MSTKFLKLLLAIYVGGFAAQAAAAPVHRASKPAAASSARTPDPQRQLPIQVEADRAELTQRQNVSVYTGHVRLVQGDLELRGDRLQVQKNPQTGDVTASLTGTPATAKQTPASGEVINARAGRMDYQTQDKSIFMQGDAEVVRGKDRINSDKIHYSIDSQKVVADSQGNNPNNRVQITIQPGQDH